MKMTNLIILCTLISQTCFAAFEENSRRYLSGTDIFWSIQSLFGYKGKNFCLQTTSSESNLSLGDNQVALGTPTIPSPNSATLGEIKKCFEHLFSQIGLVEPLRDNRDISIFLAGFSYLDDPTTVNQLFSRTSLWQNIPVNDRKLIISRHVYRILGSDDRILELGIVKNPESIRKLIFEHLEIASNRNLTFEQAVSIVMVSLVLRDEFLSF